MKVYREYNEEETVVKTTIELDPIDLEAVYDSSLGRSLAKNMESTKLRNITGHARFATRQGLSFIYDSHIPHAEAQLLQQEFSTRLSELHKLAKNMDIIRSAI